MKRRQRGFTLIEILIAAAIVGILASITLPLADIAARRTREAELRSSLRQIRDALDAYKRAADRRQIAVAADASGYPAQLEDLEAGVADITRPDHAKIHFLRRIPRDPFHPDPQVPAAETWGRRAYLSPSDSPFEGADVFDVYSKSEDVGINGVPYRAW